MNPITKLAFLTAIAASYTFAQDPLEIVRRSVGRDTENWNRAKDYTFQQRTVQRELDDKGKVKKTESETHDVIFLHGRPFNRLVEKDGKPLSDKEKAKEEKRFDEEVAKRRKQTEDANSGERRKYLKQREEQRRFAQEIPDAFNWRLVGEETMGGRAMYVIEGEPKPGYKPRDSRAKLLLPKLKGKLWIDKQEYQWVKMEAETIDTISFGMVLARLGTGSIMTFEQARINGALWLPKHAFIKIDARLALLKKIRSDIQVNFSNYQKFQTDSKFIVADQEPLTPPKQ